MLPYVLVLILVAGWAYLEKNALNWNAFWIPAIILILFATVRDYTIGTDTPTYTRNFRLHINPDGIAFNPYVEQGYQFLEHLALRISFDYSVYFFICASIIIPLTLLSIKKLSPDYVMSLFCHITYGFYTFFFSGVRQGIAMAICLYAHSFIINKKIIPAIVIIFIATLFHVSAYILFIFLISTSVKIRLEYKVLIYFIMSLLLSNVAINYMADSNDRYATYTGTVNNSGGYIILAFYSVIAFVFYIFCSAYRRKDKVYSYFEELMLCGIAFLIPIALLGTDPSGPQRFLYYFSWSVVILFPFLLRRFKGIGVRILFIVISIMYYCIATERFFSLSPYLVNRQFSFF